MCARLPVPYAAHCGKEGEWASPLRWYAKLQCFVCMLTLVARHGCTAGRLDGAVCDAQRMFYDDVGNVTAVLPILNTVRSVVDVITFTLPRSAMQKCRHRRRCARC